MGLVHYSDLAVEVTFNTRYGAKHVVAALAALVTLDDVASFEATPECARATVLIRRGVNPQAVAADVGILVAPFTRQGTRVVTDIVPSGLNGHPSWWSTPPFEAES